MEKGLFKYNPQQMTKEELEKTFIGRKKLFDSLISGLKKETSKKHHQHIILKGPRGIGKTHILSMVYFRTKEDKTLSARWIPLQFAEEEFGIRDLRGLFLRIIEELIKERNDPILSEFMANLKQENDYACIYAFLKDYLATSKKAVVIMVDNIDLILSRLVPLEAKRLRDILMNDPYLLIYAGAITLFKEIRLVSQPFYQLFKIEEVGELKEDDFEKLLRLRFELDGRQEFIKMLPPYLFSSRLKALYRLTGGNPRLLLILYQFLALGELKEVIFYLNHILDEHSQYFLDKMKLLTNQQQAIIDALAKTELLITPKEIAAKTGMKINIVTAQVSKLLNMGYLTPLKLTRPKNVTCYELGERIFRIWYQMRTGGRHKRRIQFLVTFLQIWYAEEELKREIVMMEKVYSSLRGGEAEGIKEQLEYFKEALNELVKKKERGAEQLQEAWDKITAGRSDDALTGLDEIIRGDAITEPEITSGAWFAMGYAYDDKGEYDEAIKACQKAIEIKPDYHAAWYNMGIAYRKKGEYDEAIKAYQKAIKIKPDYHAAWNNMGIAYRKKGEYDEAIKAYQKAIEIKPDDHEAWYNMGIAYVDKGEYDAAIQAYQRYIEIGLPKMNQENIGEFREAFVAIFRWLLRLKKYENADRLFRLTEDTAPADLLDLLYPIKVAIDYLLTKDKTLIERQPIEFRETILEIIKEVK